VFPSLVGTLRDPTNIDDMLKDAFEFAGEDMTSHKLRKTAATILDGAKLTARQIADQLGHATPSLTQDVYMGRGELSPAAAEALEALG
jgi:integrase